MDQSPQITAKSWIMVATLAFVWGGTFMVTELALEGMTPFWIAASRIGFAAVVMCVIWGARGFKLFETVPERGDIIALCVIGGLSGAVPFTLLAWGQQHVTAGFAGVSMASTALIILPMAHFLVPGERLTWRRIAGFVIGFIGVVILIGTQAFDTSGAALETAGRFACIGAACCYATSSILMRRLPAVDPIGLATVLLIIGTTITLPMALTVEGIPPRPGTDILLILIFLGLVPTAMANLMRVLVVRSAGPVFMSLLNYQVPVWSVVLGSVFLSEPLPPALLWAMLLILSGLAISQYGALKRLFGRPAA